MDDFGTKFTELAATTRSSHNNEQPKDLTTKQIVGVIIGTIIFAGGIFHFVFHSF